MRFPSTRDRTAAAVAAWGRASGRPLRLVRDGALTEIRKDSQAREELFVLEIKVLSAGISLLYSLCNHSL
jgi:hypothetical protein